MTKYSGESLYIEFDGTDLSGYFRSLETTEEGDQYDQTAGSETVKTYLPGRSDGNATLSMLDSSIGTALWAAVAVNTEGTLIWAPEGTASTYPKHSVNAIVKSRQKTVPYDNVVELNLAFQFSGAVTDGVYS